MSDVEMIGIGCKDCKYNDTPFHKEPCKTCRAYAPYKVKFQPKDDGCSLLPDRIR